MKVWTKERNHVVLFEFKEKRCVCAHVAAELKERQPFASLLFFLTWIQRESLTKYRLLDSQ